jgi:hypothetical protein
MVQRSYMAKICMGTLQIKIGTGWYTQTTVEWRLFKYNTEIETKEHFPLRCNFYSRDRILLISKTKDLLYVDCNAISDVDNFVILFTNATLSKLQQIMFSVLSHQTR